MLDDTEFKNFVVEKLNNIEERVLSIEADLSGMTDFASDIIGDENSVLNSDSIESLRDTLLSMATPLTGAGSSSDADSPASLEDIMASLSDFRDRISGIRSVMDVGSAEKPTE